jgi:hypothetical protein
MCGSENRKRAQWAFTTLMTLHLDEKIRLVEPDPITRLYRALLMRGDQVSTPMLKCFVDAVGVKVVHPAILRRLDERLEKVRHAPKEPKLATIQAVTEVTPVKLSDLAPKAKSKKVAIKRTPARKRANPPPVIAIGEHFGDCGTPTLGDRFPSSLRQLASQAASA